MSNAHQTTATTVDRIIGALHARLAEVPEDDVGSRRLVAAAAGAILDGSLDVVHEVRRLTGTKLRPAPPAARKPILLVASTFGTWAAELTLVAGVLLRAGYAVTIATEDGSPPHLLGPSLDPDFTDGAWRCPVVSEQERDLALRFLRPGAPEHRLLEPERIVDLGRLARPPQVGDWLRDRTTLDVYREDLRATADMADEYDALVVAGGSGAIPGLMGDRGLHSLVLAFHDLGKPVMGQCNGGLAIAQTVDPETGRSILHGRAVTTHGWLDEYQSGWGWTQPFAADTDGFWHDGRFDVAGYRAAEQWIAPGTSGNPLIDSEALFRTAAGDEGLFFSPPGSAYSVVVDGTVITCRTTPDGYPGALALIAVLDGEPPLTGRLFIDGPVGRRDPA